MSILRLKQILAS